MLWSVARRLAVIGRRKSRFSLYAFSHEDHGEAASHALRRRGDAGYSHYTHTDSVWVEADLLGVLLALALIRGVTCDHAFGSRSR